jgi:uncharacterized protein (DUF2336 family)
MSAQFTLITEVERAIAHSSAQQRGEMLLQVTDLFIRESGRYSDDEIDLFDDVITRLAIEIEDSVRSLLAHRLAPVAKAPLKIIRMLASDDEIRVAAPILAESDRLDEATLVQNARKQSQEHLLAISRRKSLSEVVTDVLVERGNKQVVLNTAKNLGARFSQVGFSRLVKRSEGDDLLSACVGARPDIPRPLFLALLATASEMVRSKLIAESPHFEHEIRDAVEKVAENIRNASRVASAKDGAAQSLVQSLNDSGQLGDDKIRAFAEGGEVEEATAALALMCNVSVDVVEQAIIQNQSETILVLAKAAKLSWATTKILLSLFARQSRIATGEIGQYLASFERLNVSTAQKIVEFYRIRRPSGKSRPA